MPTISVTKPPRKAPEGAFRVHRFMTLTHINGDDGKPLYELRDVLFIDGGSLLWVERDGPEPVLAVWHVPDGMVHRCKLFPLSDDGSEK